MLRRIVLISFLLLLIVLVNSFVDFKILQFYDEISLFLNEETFGLYLDLYFEPLLLVSSFALAILVTFWIFYFEFILRRSSPSKIFCLFQERKIDQRAPPLKK